MKKYLLFLITICLYLLFSFEGFAQGQFNKEILPSPEMESLFQFQQYPIDYNTGLPKIEIPLYQLTTGKISIPIRMQYHASGTKVDDVDGPFGVGWNLNIGGAVNRTIHGAVDFGPYSFPEKLKKEKDITPNSNLQDLAYLEKIMQFTNPGLVSHGSYIDTEYDIFSYLLPNTNGKFFFKDDEGEKKPILISSDAIKITPYFDSHGLHKIKLINGQGEQFFFDALEKTFVGQEKHATGYLLSKIIGRHKRDSIEFKYISFSQERVSRKEVIEIKSPIEPPKSSHVRKQDEISTSEKVSRKSYQVARIKEILFKQGKITFNTNLDSTRISSILIQDKQGEIIKKIGFEYETLHQFFDYKTHTLKAIKYYNNDGSIDNTYTIETYPTKYTSANKLLDYRHIDWWGYYNASGVTSMIPEQTVAFYSSTANTAKMTIGNSKTNRNPNLEALQSGVIKKIIYPTGGSTTFIYENNKYLNEDGKTVELGPGLRIAELKHDDGNNQTITKVFKYGKNEVGYGSLQLHPSLDKMTNHMTYDAFGGEGFGFSLDHNYYLFRTYYSDFVPSLGNLSSQPVRYKYVSIFIKDGEGKMNGKTVQIYEDVNPSNIQQLYPRNSSSPNWYQKKINYWDQPMLLKEEFYKYVPSINDFDLVKQIDHLYKKDAMESFEGFHVQRLKSFPQNQAINSNINSEGHFPESYAVVVYGLDIYAYGTYEISTGNKNKLSTTEQFFSNGNRTLSVLNRFEFNQYNDIKKINKKISSGHFQATEYKYPFDYNSNGIVSDQFLKKLVDQNNISNPVETTTSLNDGTSTLKTLSSQKTIYKEENGLVVPHKLQTAKGAEALEDRLIFDRYDAYGNPLEQHPSAPNAPHTVTLWGHAGQYPIAQIQNATFAQVQQALGLSGNQTPNETHLNAINALRNTKTQWLITTYEHFPLVGVKSITQPNGTTTHFEYDAFNRLKNTKDQDQKLLAAYRYHYANEN